MLYYCMMILLYCWFCVSLILLYWSCQSYISLSASKPRVLTPGKIKIPGSKSQFATICFLLVLTWLRCLWPPAAELTLLQVCCSRLNLTNVFSSNSWVNSQLPISTRAVEICPPARTARPAPACPPDPAALMSSGQCTANQIANRKLVEWRMNLDFPHQAIVRELVEII